MNINRSISDFSPGKNDNLYKYTKGGEFSLDGKEYIGEYHIMTDIPKTGPIPSKESKILQRLYTNYDHYIYDKLFKFNVPVLNFIEPVPYLYKPNEQQYAAGFDDRYFVEKIEDDLSYAIEIDAIQFININKPKGIDGGIYSSTSIRWKLTGTQQEIALYNQTEISKARVKVPSIAYAIKNFLEYARITAV